MSCGCKGGNRGHAIGVRRAAMVPGRAGKTMLPSRMPAQVRARKLAEATKNSTLNKERREIERKRRLAILQKMGKI
jgi:hypothetical protein